MTYPRARPASRRSRRTNSDAVYTGIGALLVVAVVTATMSYGFTISPDTARDKVLDAGYTNVHVGGRHILTANLRCGQGYAAWFDFTATAPNGRAVQGKVCKGDPPFRGWSIKL